MADGAIYNQLSDSTKKAIDEQIAYLNKCADEYFPEEKERFTTLREGAQTVLRILMSDKICDTGTTAWLKNLDRNQLEHAISSAKEILKAKTSQGKVALFGVFGGKDGSKWYGDKDEAESYYLVAAKESLSKRYPEVSIEKRLVPIEELAEFLGEEIAATYLKAAIKIT